MDGLNTTTLDPALQALAVMRDMQDRVFETDDRHPDRAVMQARLRATETVALMTRPTTRAGALELLRYCSVEVRCEALCDVELVADAIDHCAAVLENYSDL